MLGKLMKYELKATARLFIPMFIILLVLSSINRVFLELSGYSTSFTLFPEGSTFHNIISTLAGITTVVYVFAIIAIAIITFIIFVFRFYKNMLGDEGYLMMTLPVKTSQHLWAKLHTAAIWSVSTFLVCILSIMILLVNGNSITWLVDNLPKLLQAYFNINLSNKVHILFYMIEFVVTLILSVYSTVVFYYGCLAIGHRMSRKHKLLYALGAFLVISFIVEVASVIVMMVGAAAFGFALESIPPQWIGHIAMIGSIVLAVIQFVIFFLITENTLTKHLNLE